MSIRKLAYYPDPLLSKKSDPVTDVDDDVRALANDMFETMYDAGGIGLAAVQVKALTRLFIVDPTVAGGQESDPPRVFINPEILALSDDTEVADEGCLSFPGVYVPVKRSVKCRVRARDLAGEPFEVEGENLFARVMQHEYDHLEGRLLSDHVGPLKRKMLRRRVARELAQPNTDQNGVSLK